MSEVESMEQRDRFEAYLRQTGRSWPTPRQGRRAYKKALRGNDVEAHQRALIDAVSRRQEGGPR